MHSFDITSPSYYSDPFPTLARIREAGPLVRTRFPILGKVWLVSHYEAVDAVLRDHQRFVRDARTVGKSWISDLQAMLGKLVPAAAENMLAKDEPDHRRLRGLIDAAFQRRQVEHMRSRIEQLADQILDESMSAAAASSTFDFLYFARQFPLAVICELMGLPDQDRPRFTSWANGFSNISSLMGLMKLFPRMFKIHRYFREQFRSCRRQPRDGLLSLLVQAEQDGETLNERELSAMAFLLLFAGHHTTTHFLSTGLLALLDHPQQKQRLIADWSIAESAVNELLRFNSPVQVTKLRIVKQDMTYYGQSLRRGEYLVPFLAAANSDPAQFPNPQSLDLTRSPNPHLGFGTGIHVCVGMKLAVMEAEVAFEKLFSRAPDIRLAVPREQVQWNKQPGLRALKSLPVTTQNKARAHAVSAQSADTPKSSHHSTTL